MGHIVGREHPHRHIHKKSELLFQHLQRIGDFHIRECRQAPLIRRNNLQIGRRISDEPNRTVAQRAYIEALPHIIDGYRSAPITQNRRIAVRALHIGFTHEIGDAVPHNRIAFHLADTQAPLISTTSRGRVCPLLLAPLCARIPLVLRHVL